MKDMRRINEVWQACNHLGEWFTYARVGSSKNAFITTLAVGAMADRYQHLVGKRYSNG